MSVPFLGGLGFGGLGPLGADRNERVRRINMVGDPAGNVRRSKEIRLRGKTFILIHGFMAAPVKTVDRWEKFVDNVSKTARIGEDLQFNLVTWPGRRFRFNAWARAVSASTESSRQLADSLVGAIKSRNGAPQIVVVAHSLGCHLALSAFSDPGLQAELQERKLLERTYLVLMAGAVSASDVEVNGQFRTAVSLISRTCVMHSPRDTILTRYYPWAEWLCRRPGARAIGVNGAPKELWRRRVERREWLRAGWQLHIGYWKNLRSAATICQHAGLARVRQMPGEWWTPWLFAGFDR
jgi:alpha/beta hydrolase family protein DUF900